MRVLLSSIQAYQLLFAWVWVENKKGNEQGVRDEEKLTFCCLGLFKFSPAFVFIFFPSFIEFIQIFQARQWQEGS